MCFRLTTKLEEEYLMASASPAAEVTTVLSSAPIERLEGATAWRARCTSSLKIQSSGKHEASCIFGNNQPGGRGTWYMWANVVPKWPPFARGGERVTVSQSDKDKKWLALSAGATTVQRTELRCRYSIMSSMCLSFYVLRLCACMSLCFLSAQFQS